MTFEEFQKSRKWHDSLEWLTGMDDVEGGYAYNSDSLYIERTEDGFLLTLDRDQYSEGAEGLESLERRLYEFAQDEGWV